MRFRAVIGVIAVGVLIVLGLAHAGGGRLLGQGPRPAVSPSGAIEATRADVSVTIAVVFSLAVLKLRTQLD